MSEQAIALHRHLEQAYLALAQALKPEWYQELGGTWFFSNHPFSLCNGVLRTECAGIEEADQLIQQIKKQAEARQASFLWLIGPATRPLDLAQRLQEQELAYDETVKGMLLDLSSFPEDQHQLAHLTINPVETAEHMEAWLRAFTTGFGFPEPVKQVFFRLYRTYGFVAHPARRLYLGTIDSDPVATSLLFLDGEMAGIYAVATIPDARRMGIGTKMTRVAVEEACRLGYAQITLQATSMGASLYRRLGFRDVCDFHTYRWR